MDVGLFFRRGDGVRDDSGSSALHPEHSKADLSRRAVSLEINRDIRPLAHFGDYLKYGYFPYFCESVEAYHSKLAHAHALRYPAAGGDFIVDDQWLFEIGRCRCGCLGFCIEAGACRSRCTQCFD